jgi:hypothetical protein
MRKPTPSRLDASQLEFIGESVTALLRSYQASVAFDPGTSEKKRIAVSLPTNPEIGDALIEVIGGYEFRIPLGESCTIGSGPEANIRIEHPSVAPLHLRIDNKVTPTGRPSHPFNSLVMVSDIGGGSSGPNLFGGESDRPSRTGVVKDVSRNFVMPLELGETTSMENGTVVLFGELQLRLVTGG